MNLSPRPLMMLCLLLPCLLLLAACKATRAESRPTGTYADCDPALVGSWRVTELRTEGNMDELATVVIPTGCQPITSQKSGTPAERLDHFFKISYARVGQLHLLVGRENTDHVPAGTASSVPRGMLVLRYDASPQRIAMYPIDDALVTRRIVDGTLSGQTHAMTRIHPRQTKAQNTVIESLIEGNEDEIATVLQSEPSLFSTQPVIVLQRVSANDAAP